MNCKTIPLVAAAVVLAYSVGCTTDKIHSVMRAKPSPISDFLPDHKLLVKQADTFPFHYFYMKPDHPRYEYVRIAPVDTSYLRKSSSWAEFDKKLNGKLGDDVSALADFMRKAYVQAFEKCSEPLKLTVTERTDLPNTLVLETALIALAPTKAELNVAGTAASFALPVLGAAACYASAGQIIVECRMKDAKTGEVIAMYADTEDDPAALIPVAQMTWTSSARINIKTLAAQTAKVLAVPNYEKIRRDFPVGFVTRIVDGNLDK